MGSVEAGEAGESGRYVDHATGDGVVVSEVSAVTKTRKPRKKPDSPLRIRLSEPHIDRVGKVLETGCKPRRFRRLNATVETPEPSSTPQ